MSFFPFFSIPSPFSSFCVNTAYCMLLCRSMRAVHWILPVRNQRGFPVCSPYWTWVLMWMQGINMVKISLTKLKHSSINPFIHSFWKVIALLLSHKEKHLCSMPWPAVMDSPYTTQKTSSFYWREVLTHFTLPFSLRLFIRMLSQTSKELHAECYSHFDTEVNGLKYARRFLAQLERTTVKHLTHEDFKTCLLCSEF